MQNRREMGLAAALREAVGATALTFRELARIQFAAPWKNARRHIL